MRIGENSAPNVAFSYSGFAEPSSYSALTLERHARSSSRRPVHEAAVLAEPLPMIAEDDEDRILIESQLLVLVEVLPVSVAAVLGDRHLRHGWFAYLSRRILDQFLGRRRGHLIVLYDRLGEDPQAKDGVQDHQYQHRELT